VSWAEQTPATGTFTRKRPTQSQTTIDGGDAVLDSGDTLIDATFASWSEQSPTTGSWTEQ
jgi:hypothetical protein